jgi:hypothetical protein
MAKVNRRFHATLIEVCALPRMVRIIRQLWDATEVYRAVSYTDEPNRDRVVHEHRDLVEAACARDTEGLLAVLASHRANAITALRPVLGPSRRRGLTPPPSAGSVTALRRWAADRRDVDSEPVGRFDEAAQPGGKRRVERTLGRLPGPVARVGARRVHPALATAAEEVLRGHDRQSRRRLQG